MNREKQIIRWMQILIVIIPVFTVIYNTLSTQYYVNLPHHKKIYSYHDFEIFMVSYIKADDSLNLIKMITDLQIPQEYFLSPKNPDGSGTYLPMLQHIAESRGREPDFFQPCFQAILNRGIDVNSNSQDGTALYHAVRMGNLEAAEYLIQIGADINLADWHQKTPLHIAVEVCNNKPNSRDYDRKLQIVKLLISHGAKVDLKDYIGTTVCDYLHHSEYYYIASYLSSEKVLLKNFPSYMQEYIKSLTVSK